MALEVAGELVRRWLVQSLPKVVAVVAVAEFTAKLLQLVICRTPSLSPSGLRELPVPVVLQVPQAAQVA
jgi:hypothetical protein